MSLARTGALPNSYKYFTIAVESFHEKRMEGVIYHESREGAAPFKGLIQMAHILNYISDEIHYPMKSLDERLLQKKALADVQEEAVFSDCGLREIKGSLATFRLHIKYRYYATWQGTITQLETGAVYAFESFKELMHLFEELLGDGREEQTALGKRMCAVAVCDYREQSMVGEVSHPAVTDRFPFQNEFSLLAQLEHMFGERPEDAAGEAVIVPRQGNVYKGSVGPLTFLVRILFNKNATWQGVICWKETGEQASFRSYLEMMLMMEGAVKQVVYGWSAKPDQKKVTA